MNRMEGFKINKDLILNLKTYLEKMIQLSIVYIDTKSDILTGFSSPVKT